MELLRELILFIVDNNLGDVASVVGVSIALVGFGITIFNVVKSRRAADQARDAVAAVRERLAEVNTIADLSEATAILDEIRRLNRVSAWPILPDRYSQLKRVLISVRASRPDLSDDHKAAIQGVVQHVTRMEGDIEKIIANAEDYLDVPRQNRIIARQSEKLTEMIVSLKIQISG